MTVALSEVAAVIRGVTFDKHESADVTTPDHVPILRAGNIGIDLAIDQDLVWVPARRVSSEQMMLPGDIAICMSSGSASVVGKTATLHVPWRGSVGAFCAIVRPSADRIEPEYLSFFLRSPSFRDWTCQSTGANIKNIRKSELEAFPVSVPSRAEQRRIIDLLTRAEGIVRLRREAQRKAAELIPAIFVDMFGDPAVNPKDWPVVPLSELVEEFRYGTSVKSGPSGLPVLRIPNVVRDSLDLDEVKFVALEDAERRRLVLKNDDLLFVRTNGNPDFVGRCAVFEQSVPDAAGLDGGNCVYASYLIRARLRTSQVRATYLQTMLSTGEGRRLLRERAKTSAGQYNINIDGLGSIPVPIPPRELQDKFVRLAKRFRQLQSQHLAANEGAQATFNALLAQAFTR